MKLGDNDNLMLEELPKYNCSALYDIEYNAFDEMHWCGYLRNFILIFFRHLRLDAALDLEQKKAMLFDRK